MVQESDVVVLASRSVVRYTPKTEMDFGSLVCWASNEVGLGVPCVYHLLPIGPPEPPADCLTYNITYSSLQVRTIPVEKCTADLKLVLNQLFILWRNYPVNSPAAG